MIFIGSHHILQSISIPFRDVWITLIRQFNRAFPKRADTEQIRKNISSLQEKVAILQNETLKKIEKLPEDAQYEKAKHTFTSLETALGKLNQELIESSQHLPKDWKKDYAQFKHSKIILIIQLKEIKALITLAVEDYVRVGRRLALVKGAKITGAAVIALLGTGSASLTTLHYYLTYKARNLPTKEDGLAILISYSAHSFADTWLRNNAELFIPMYVARVELAFGQKANIVKKAATRQDFYDIIRNDSIQNIILFGHGSWNSWEATDDTVDAEDLWPERTLYTSGKRYTFGFPQQKRGYLVRHTCGQGQDIVEKRGIIIQAAQWKEIQSLVWTINQQLYPNYVLKLEKIEFRFQNNQVPVYLGIDFWIARAVQGKEVIPSNPEEDFIIYQAIRLQTDKGQNIKEIDYSFASLESNIEYCINRRNEQKQTIALTATKRLRILTELIFQQPGEIKLEVLPLLGTPVFSRDRIKGWGRVVSPWDFMINVFGQGYRKADKLYAMK